MTIDIKNVKCLSSTFENQRKQEKSKKKRMDPNGMQRVNQYEHMSVTILIIAGRRSKIYARMHVYRVGKKKSGP